MNNHIFEHFLKKLQYCNLFSIFIDIKKSNSNKDEEIYGIGIYIPIQKDSIYIPFFKDIKLKKKLNIDYILIGLKPYLENDAQKKIGFDLKKYYFLLKKYNIQLSGIKFDVMLELYLINSSLFSKKVHHKTKQYEEKINFFLQKKNFLNNNINNVAKTIFDLHQKIWNQIKKNEKIKKIFNEIDIPLILVICRMEENGILINTKKLEENLKKINSKILNLISKTHQLLGEKINLSSNKQLIHVLSQKKIILNIKTKKGHTSINESVLQQLIDLDPLPKIILKYRQMKKIQSTYLNGILKKINTKTGKIYTSYYQTTTISGRMSSRSPNLQNIPVKNIAGINIRELFIPTSGYIFLSADYSQIELRILAHLSQDQTLINAFTHDQDIHLITASEIFNIKHEQVTHQQRQIAKIINFSLIYGMTSFGLSKKLKIDLSCAKKYKKIYFEKYIGIYNYLKNIILTTQKNGFISTMQGRKLFVNNINSKNYKLKKSAERTAINIPIQGTASDMIKSAMIKIDYWLQKKFSLEGKLLMQIHDELIFEIKEPYLQKIKQKIQYLMQNSLILDIPIKVNIKIGHNWKNLI